MNSISDKIRKLQKQFDPDISHSNHVEKLSSQIFNSLQPLHGYGQAEQKLLYAGSLLHDIGYYVNGNHEHHKNSMKLILKHGIEGFTEKQILMVANIAQYHRKALPSPKHKHWAKLEENEKDIVCKLSAILRIADGLDRSHRNLVHKISCKISPNIVTVYMGHFDELNNEIKSARRKSDLFKEVFRREITFIPKRFKNYKKTP